MWGEFWAEYVMSRFALPWPTGNKQIDHPSRSAPVLVYSWEECVRDCQYLARLLRGITTVLCPIPRGGMVPAYLIHRLHLESTLLPVGPGWEQHAQAAADRGEQVVLIDDVSDTGTTLAQLVGLVNPMCVATLHYKHWSAVKPDYYIHATDRWVCYPWEVEEQYDNG